MQLESSVFGVAVIQIKPQLEALLGLPEDSLAKEIKLTEDLMELFVEYQVPSDLLSYDVNGNGTTLSSNQKVDAVRGNVKAVMDVIEGEKEKQLEKALMEKDARKAAADRLSSSSASSESDCSNDESAPGGFVRERRTRGAAPNKKNKKKMMAKKSRARALPPPAPKMAMAFVPPAPLSAMAPPKSAAANQNIIISESLPVPTSEIAKPIKNIDAKSMFDASSKIEGSPSKQSVDFTSIPKTLDSTIEQFNKDSNLRSTKLKTKESWSRKRQPDLLTKPTTTSLSASDVKSESNKAFDLLDAISRSGSLPIAYSDLHVVVCVTHCFEKDVMATVVEENVNPIEKLEMSTLLLGSAIHGATPLELIAEESDRVRFQSTFPLALEEGTPL